MVKRIFLIVCVLAVALGCIGCNWLRSSCAKALPVIAAAQSYGQDAQIALDQADTAIRLMPLPEAQKKKAEYAVESCRVALRVAQQLIAAGADACSAQDPFAVFKDFIRAWNVLEPLLAKPGVLGAAPGGTPVYAPAIVLAARAKGAQP
jgi:hypothetical protein